MKHFHTIEADDENDENTNANDDGKASALSAAAPLKASVPRIRIRLGKKSSSSLSAQQQPGSSSNSFGLQVESLDSFSFDNEDEDDDDDEETIQLLKDDDSSASESAAEAQDPSSVVLVHSTPSPKSHRKRVSFGMVQVQEYNLTLGDHPFSDSYPLSLDWPHTDSKEYHLDLFERTRRGSATPSASASPRSGRGGVACRHLSPAQRRSRLANISGIHPSDLARQEQRRHQQLVVEMEQSYYSSEMDVDAPDEQEWSEPSLLLLPPATPSHAASDRAPFAPFWENDHAFDLEAFEPLEFSRSKSVAEFDPMDCSLLEYLCDGDRTTGALDVGSLDDTNDAFRVRRRQKRDDEFGCAECHQEDRRRKSSPW